MIQNITLQKIFYKNDTKTGQLRLSKTMIISSLIFLISLLSELTYVGLYENIFFGLYHSIFIALGNTYIIFLIGWFIGYYIDNKNKTQPVNSREFYLNNASNFIQLRKYTDALYITKEWTNMYPYDAEAYYLKSAIATDLKLEDEAKTSIQQALNMDINNQKYNQMNEMINEFFKIENSNN